MLIDYTGIKHPLHLGILSVFLHIPAGQLGTACAFRAPSRVWGPRPRGAVAASRGPACRRRRRHCATTEARGPALGEPGSPPLRFSRSPRAARAARDSTRSPPLGSARDPSESLGRWARGLVCSFPATRWPPSRGAPRAVSAACLSQMNTNILLFNRYLREFILNQQIQ